MPFPTPSRRALRAAACVAPVGLAAAVYAPIVGNYFFADDFVHLYQVANGDPVRFLLFPQGGHLYLLRNAVFWVTATLLGPLPRGYFCIVLATHLVNVGLLFAALHVFSRSLAIAALGATLWGVSPLHGETLGWYSVYGQVLATTLVLLVVLDAGRVAAGAVPPSSRRTWLWVALMLLAANAFGTALGPACVFPLLPRLLGVPGTRTRAMQVRLWLLPLGVLALYAASLAAYAALYEPPRTTMSPRVALAAGVGPVLAMLLHLLGAGLTGLLHPIGLTRSTYPGPVAVALIAGTVVGAAVAWQHARPADRRRALAFLLLAVAGYGMVSLGRAVFYLINNLPLASGATTFRYHYLPSAALALLLGSLAVRLPVPERGRPAWWDAAAALALATLAALVLSRGRPVDHHQTARRQIDDFHATVVALARAVPVGDTAYITNHPFPLLMAITPPEEFPGWAALFVVFFRSDVVEGRPVRFVAQDAATLAATRIGGRIASILVAEEH